MSNATLLAITPGDTRDLILWIDALADAGLSDLLLRERHRDAGWRYIVTIVGAWRAPCGREAFRCQSSGSSSSSLVRHVVLPACFPRSAGYAAIVGSGESHHSLSCASSACCVVQQVRLAQPPATMSLSSAATEWPAALWRCANQTLPETLIGGSGMLDKSVSAELD